MVASQIDAIRTALSIHFDNSFDRLKKVKETYAYKIARNLANWVRHGGLFSLTLAIGAAIPAKANADVDITECGPIKDPGLHVLTNNLTASGGVCLTVSADSVTLDLAGFMITGQGGTGIFGAPNNLVVRNGTVTGFSDGILVGSPLQGSIVEGVRAINNQSRGIVLTGAPSVVRGNTVVGNGATGIFTGENANVSDNTVFQNGADGISASAGSIVTDNRVQSNKELGIIIRPGEGDSEVAGSGALVSGNVVRMNGDGGIIAGRGSAVTGNIAQRNGPQGSPVGIQVAPGSTVSNNTAEGNSITAFCGTALGFIFHNISTPAPQGNITLNEIRTERCVVLENVGTIRRPSGLP
jgi:hypothetical protein